MLRQKSSPIKAAHSFVNETVTYFHTPLFQLPLTLLPYSLLNFLVTPQTLSPLMYSVLAYLPLTLHFTRIPP